MTFNSKTTGSSCRNCSTSISPALLRKSTGTRKFYTKSIGLVLVASPLFRRVSLLWSEPMIRGIWIVLLLSLCVDNASPVRVRRGCCQYRTRIEGRGPIRVSPTSVAALRPKTVDQYRRVLGVFLSWLHGLGLQPETAAEWDDLLVEFRYQSDGAPAMSKGNYEHLVSAVERVVPNLRGLLLLAHSEISAWRITYTVHHSVPLIPPWAHFLAYGCLKLGIPAVGALILLQSLTGLRPSEGLGLRREDVVLPSDLPPSTEIAGFLLLGVKVGTKSRRPQSVRVTHPLALMLMTLL